RDDGQLEVRQRHIEVPVRQRLSGGQRVAVGEFVGERQLRRRPGGGRVGGQVQRRSAVDAHQRRVADRVAEGGELPVHDGAYLLGIVGIQDGVVDAIVAVHDREAALLRK